MYNFWNRFIFVVANFVWCTLVTISAWISTPTHPSIIVDKTISNKNDCKSGHKKTLSLKEVVCRHWVLLTGRCLEYPKRIGGFLRVLQLPPPINWLPWYYWNSVESCVKPQSNKHDLDGCLEDNQTTFPFPIKKGDNLHFILLKIL